jgi:hypothetical protein
MKKEFILWILIGEITEAILFLIIIFLFSNEKYFNKEMVILLKNLWILTRGITPPIGFKILNKNFGRGNYNGA